MLRCKLNEMQHNNEKITPLIPRIMVKVNNPKIQIPRQIPRWLIFIIGGTSGGLAICVVQPMDLLKTRMQLLGLAGKKASTLAVAKSIVANEGFRGFYGGISAALFRQATYSTSRLGCFYCLLDAYKDKYGGPPNFGTKIALAMASGGVGGFIGTPAEVALIRMTADGRLPFEKRRNYHHVFDALARITREEGVLMLWRGCAPTVTRAMVVNGAELGSYTQARQVLLPYLGDGIILHSCASMIAGLISTVSSLPVDMVKTRIQNAEIGTTQLTVLKSVIKNEGFLALFSGFLPTYGKLGPHVLLQFVILEQLNALYFRLTEPGTTSKLKP